LVVGHEKATPYPGRMSHTKKLDGPSRTKPGETNSKDLVKTEVVPKYNGRITGIIMQSHKFSTAQGTQGRGGK